MKQGARDEVKQGAHDPEKSGTIEMVAVGHVTVDHVNGSVRAGGAVAYAALTARRLGIRVGVVTSFADDYPFFDLLSGIPTRVIQSKQSTVFDNVYQDGARGQRIRSLAAPIEAKHLQGIRLADRAAVLYCPVAHEVELPFRRLAPGGLIGVAPQGFFRRWDVEGVVSIRQWDDAPRALAEADVVCISEDDVTVPEDLATTFTGRAFVVTKGAAGCRVYADALVYDYPALPAEEVDPTGAGDSFAAAFVASLARGASLPKAAEIAARAGADAVASVGLRGLL